MACHRAARHPNASDHGDQRIDSGSEYQVVSTFVAIARVRVFTRGSMSRSAAKSSERYVLARCRYERERVGLPASTRWRSQLPVIEWSTTQATLVYWIRTRRERRSSLS